MTTDYDAPRQPQIDAPRDNTLTQLNNHRIESRFGVSDIGEAEADGPMALAGLDALTWSDDDLNVTIVPKQKDEFLCARCFLVRHQSRLAQGLKAANVCRDCADQRKPARTTAVRPVRR
jgi:hypothetical protein